MLDGCDVLTKDCSGSEVGELAVDRFEGLAARLDHEREADDRSEE